MLWKQCKPVDPSWSQNHATFNPHIEILLRRIKSKGTGIQGVPVEQYTGTGIPTHACLSHPFNCLWT